MHQWTVDDVMTTSVVVADEDASVAQIVDLLANHRISGVPIVGDDDRVVGVVSQADLLPRVALTGQIGGRPGRRRRAAKAAGSYARELMSTPAVTIAPTAPIDAAARRMQDKNVRRLLVTNDTGQLLGIVSPADLLRPYTRPDPAIRQDVVDDVLRRILWIDTAQVQVSVHAGVVTLSGAVGRRTTAAIAAHRAEEVPGVVRVVNEIRYDHDDADIAFSRVHRTHPFSAAPFAP